MAVSQTKFRAVLEPLTLFDAPNPALSTFSTLSVFTVSDSQTLIYVGTQSGDLLLLSLNPNSISTSSAKNSSSAGFDDSMPRNVSFLRSVSVGASSVEWVHVIGDIGGIVVLSGGFLYVVDSFLLQPVKRLSTVKGVSVVARRLRSGLVEYSDLSAADSGNASESKTSSQRFLKKLSGGVRANGFKTPESELQRDGDYIFGMVVGKKVILAQLLLDSKTVRNTQGAHSFGGSLLVLREFQCFDGIKAMLWIDDSIIVGTSKGYSLISCVTGENALIFSLPDPSSLPQLKLLGKEYKVLLLVDNVGVTVDCHGQPIGGSLIFRGSAISVSEVSSYVVIVRDGKMELYHKNSGNCIQMLRFPGEEVGKCVVASDEGGSGKVVALATPSHLLPESTFRRTD